MSTISISPSTYPSTSPATRMSRKARSRPGVRLTRRGRVVVFLAALSLVLGAALLFAGGAVGTGEAGPPPATETVQVAPGDTLWGIASQIAEDGEVRAVMEEIRRLNALDSAVLNAGQMLRVPASID